MKARIDQEVKRFFLWIEGLISPTSDSPLPEWIQSRTRRNAEDSLKVLTCLSAALITLAQLARTKIVTRHHLGDGNQSVVDYLRALKVAIRLSYDGAVGLELTDHIDFIADRLQKDPRRLAELEKHLPVTRSREDAYCALTALICEGYSGSGKYFTPSDVALFMLQKRAGLEVDVYAPSGLGLFWASSRVIDGVTDLVGNEGVLTDRVQGLPDWLNEAFCPSAIGTCARVTFERLLIDLECWVRKPVRERDAKRALLINAATLPVPFSPPYPNEALRPDKESLNFLLAAGYDRVIALVPNIYLTGGAAFRPAEILTHLVKNGLCEVTQLPLGVIGAKHESYSVLVFDSTAQRSGIRFHVLREEKTTSIAARGFGQTNRRYTLKDSFLTSSDTTTFFDSRTVTREELHQEYLYTTTTTRKKGRLPSVEASHFISVGSAPLVEDIEEWVTLEKIAEIHRVQYIPECDEVDGISFNEITTETIGEFGELDGMRGKFHRSEDEPRVINERLQADDVLLCIRGPIGKVALVSSSALVDSGAFPLLPNQSFVRLRPLRTSNEKQHEIQGDLLYWWLRSAPCQRYFQAKTVSSGVGRLAIQDIRKTPCPILTLEMTQTWRAQLASWQGGIEELKAIRLKLRAELRS